VRAALGRRGHGSGDAVVDGDPTADPRPPAYGVRMSPDVPRRPAAHNAVVVLVVVLLTAATAAVTLAVLEGDRHAAEQVEARRAD
jgi:hypothetical protein